MALATSASHVARRACNTFMQPVTRIRKSSRAIVAGTYRIEWEVGIKAELDSTAGSEVRPSVSCDGAVVVDDARTLGGVGRRRVGAVRHVGSECANCAVRRQGGFDARR